MKCSMNLYCYSRKNRSFYDFNHLKFCKKSGKRERLNNHEHTISISGLEWGCVYYKLLGHIIPSSCFMFVFYVFVFKWLQIHRKLHLLVSSFQLPRQRLVLPEFLYRAFNLHNINVYDFFLSWSCKILFLPFLLRSTSK